jgi:spermidine/putrescine ABC transporter ATP-binding subunit
MKTASAASSAAGADLELDGISKRFGSVVALAPLRLTVPGGSLIALLGPSGCGKTTTLRIVAGFERPDAGSVRVGGRDITDLAPNRRRLGMVFQNYSLFPHMNVADNIGFGLKMAGRPGAEIARDVSAALERVKLSGFGERFVHQLSGGQQQRVALARSIVTNPSVLLLDEPLGALDKNLRESMQFELRQLQRTLGITSVLVTHDQEEALTMADAVAVMRDGVILQHGPPEEVYERPKSRFVAEFLGASNILALTGLSGSGAGSIARSEALGVAIESAAAPVAGVAHASLRPEKVQLSRKPAEAAASNAVRARVIGHVFRGSQHAFQVLAEGGAVLVAYQSPREFAETPLNVGDEVSASWRREDVVLLSE